LISQVFEWGSKIVLRALVEIDFVSRRNGMVSVLRAQGTLQAEQQLAL
jgi:hypothetical protein